MIPGFPDLPSITGGAGGAAGPSAARGDSAFDSSGWNVNFSSGSIASNAGGLGAYAPYVLAAAAVVIAWRMTRRKR